MASLKNDKVAVVTGSSSGIGEAIAIAFASHGVKVTLSGRDQERLKSVFDKTVKANGGHLDRVHTVQGDVNDPNIREIIISQTVKKFGRLDILVANAGTIDLNGTVSNATGDNYDAVMDTNLKSVFFLIQQAIPHLEKSKGNIISISSIASTMVIPFATIYSMSKAGLDQLTRSLAVDLGPKGIRVNGINPGYIPTRIVRNFGADLEKVNREFEKAESGRAALKERGGTVEDIAELATFLASDAASFITGENIKVDGGRNLIGAIDWSPL